MTSAATAASVAAMQATEHEQKRETRRIEEAQEQEAQRHKPPKGNRASGMYGAFRRRQSDWRGEDGRETPSAGPTRQRCLTCHQGATHLPLDELANKKYGKTFSELNKLEGTTVIRGEMSRCRCLLNPGSPSMQRWGIVVLIALVFTSVMTPFEVAFIEPSVGLLFFLNRLIDLVFAVDMVFNFLLMYKISTPSGTIWVKDHRLIAKRYAKSWLMLDIISILPFDITSLLDGDTPILSQLKGLRIIRAFRMLKLVRMMKAAKFIEEWQNYVAVSFAKLTLIKVAVGLFCVSHWMACFWGLLGKLVGTSLVCEPDSYKTEWNFYEDNSGVSWISAHYADGHADSPCNPIELYASSLHYSTMTITSIGHGDINPQRFEEYLCCCLCMLIGAITWAITIGTMSGAIYNLDPQTNYFESLMDDLNYMMKDEEMPHSMKMRLREHFNESQNALKTETYDQLKAQMSEALAGDTVLQENYKHLQKIWYFNRCRREFMVEVAAAMQMTLYAPRERVEYGLILYMIRRGVVAFPGAILTVGCSWGEDIILEGDALRYEYHTMAVTFSELSSLRRKDLFAALQNYPYEYKWINRARIKLACIRGVIAAAHRVREELAKEGIQIASPQKSHFLTEAFSKVAMTNLIHEKTDEAAKDTDDEEKFTLTGNSRISQSADNTPTKSKSSMLNRMNSAITNMRAAADAHEEDPSLLQPETEIFETSTSKSAPASLGCSEKPKTEAEPHAPEAVPEVSDETNKANCAVAVPSSSTLADEGHSPHSESLEALISSLNTQEDQGNPESLEALITSLSTDADKEDSESIEALISSLNTDANEGDPESLDAAIARVQADSRHSESPQATISNLNIHEDEEDPDSLEATINSMKEERPGETTLMETPIGFPKLPEKLDIWVLRQELLNKVTELQKQLDDKDIEMKSTTRNLALNLEKEPIQKTLQFSLADMQQIANAIANKVEQHSSPGEGRDAIDRSVTTASLQAIQSGQMPWRLQGSEKVERYCTM